VLDLDILLYDNLILDDPRLTLPHPRMHCRRFVLKPLCDIAPHTVHPLLGRTAQELLAELPEEGQQVVELE
jgi:7,8-dihydro-6-hydroxymethylpterin-pyrophosphokinase